MTHSSPTRRSSDLRIVERLEIPHLTGNRRRRLGTVGRECAAREQHGAGQCEQKSFHRVHHTAKRRSAIMSQNETRKPANRSEEHTSELQSLMRTSYAVFCLKKKQKKKKKSE